MKFTLAAINAPLSRAGNERTTRVKIARRNETRRTEFALTIPWNGTMASVAPEMPVLNDRDELC